MHGGMTESHPGDVKVQGPTCARFPLCCGKTSGTFSRLHSSISIGSRKGQDDDLANYHRHEMWNDSVGPPLSEENTQSPLANSCLVRRGDFGKQTEKPNQIRTQTRCPSATPGSCSTRELRARSDGSASVGSSAACHPVRPASRRIHSARCARAAFSHILPCSPVGSRPRVHHGRKLFNREPSPCPLRRLPAQLVPALRQRPAAEAPYPWGQGLVSRPQLP